MYYFCFNRFVGPDRVCKFYGLEQGAFDESKNKYSKIKPGDLLKYKDEFFLCLGEQVSFQELYTFEEEFGGLKIEFFQKGFLNKHTVELIHWMVEQNLTHYKKVVNLFVDFDINRLYKYFDKKSIKPKGVEYQYDQSLLKLVDKGNSIEGQQLIVFPDLWTLSNQVDPNNLGSKGVGFIHGQSTFKQRSDVFWGLRNGTINTLICTYSGIFMDYKKLSKITVVDSHKWYYKSQQDPRYYVPDVLQKLAELHECKYEKFGLDI